MRGISYFCMVLGVSYLMLVAMEYNKVIQSQNWTLVNAKVEKSINGIPLTKFEPNKLNDVTAFFNWSYIRYHYVIGAGQYDAEQELGPHLSILDSIVGPLKERLPAGSTIEIRYNPRNPNESKVGFDVFRPIETYGGTAAIWLALGVIMYYMSRVTESTLSDDQELNMPLEYFDKKRKGLK
jgi:hypothetical protein